MRKSFVLLKGFEPKKPLSAENGEGCADSITKFSSVFIIDFLKDNLENSGIKSIELN